MQDFTGTEDSRGDLPFSMYNAFCSTPYAGSAGAVVLNASEVPRAQRVRIAREIGAPATAFVSAIKSAEVEVQFFSTVMELPMCGHGTMCLVTSLVDAGLLPAPGTGRREITLSLPKGSATVAYHQTREGRVEVMLDVTPARYTSAELDLEELAGLLGARVSDVPDTMPILVASADFIHLCLPFHDLDAIGRLNPSFPELAAFCRRNGIETVATFTLDTIDPAADLHVRDFCPAVGVAESAAAGTTNAALAGYLMQVGLTPPVSPGCWTIRAEQGIEIGRPSQITTLIDAENGVINRIRVGGVASRVLSGHINPRNMV
ncbi:PhzF family phenazine biosynthesis isomerase [Ruegeria sp. HKCCD4884]|uniref:PhzF family phenazine biosynthesis protein n=1 Tax=Ruegeria sp. HKCCD4884 TaxID=2683022 RepID=UPI001491BD47|nr:PhzF family phenazine biosynthesis protein [Ruegeria sp. HKCCD4884]NOD95229.1 PhzF family phenazine biosynthesis isomerase [Ruegeria sp. HKCCD4884]